MKESRDRFDTTYRSRPNEHWEPRSEAALERVTDPQLPERSRKRRKRILALVLGASVLAFTALVGLATSTHDVMPVVPAWDLQVSSGGTRSVVAFVYGKEAGLQLVRIPPKGSSRTIPARLGQAPVFLVSLGWSGLVATGEAPSGERPMSWSASGRVVQAYSNSHGTGVRVW
jgi:hypothetical protein